MKDRIFSWFKVWYQPRATIREVINSRSGNRVYLFMVLAGLVVFFSYFDLINAGDNKPIGALVARALILGPLTSLLVTVLFTAGLYLTVRLMKGKVRYGFISTVIGRGYFPYVLGFVIWTLNLAFLDGAGFSGAEGASTGYWIIALLNIASLIAVPVYTVIFLAEITRSKLWYAALMYVSGLILGGVIGGVIYILFTLLANLIMVFNDPRYTFFFPFISK